MEIKLSAVWSSLQLFVAEMFACFVAFLPVYTLLSQPGLLAPAVCGLAVYIGIWVTFPAGGGHITPMVTLAALITRRIHICRAIVYLCAQFAGTILAMGIGKLISPASKSAGETAGMTLPGLGVSAGAAIFAEAVATLSLVTVVLASLDELRGPGWRLDSGTFICSGVGIMVLLDVAMFGHISGASMNPTRSLCAAIIQGNFTQQWIYFVGPPLGSILASFLYEILISPGSSKKRLHAWFCTKNFDRTATEEDRRAESHCLESSC